MSKYTPPSASALLRRVDQMDQFISALTEHYGVREVKNPLGHRQFTNPWSGQSGAFIFIRKNDAQVRYGESITRSNIMSEKLLSAIIARTLRVPGSTKQADPGVTSDKRYMAA